MAPSMSLQDHSYTDMLEEANQARWVIYNICAGISTWLLLAAFLIIPGTFTSLRESTLFQHADQANTAAFAKDILLSVAHVGLLGVAGAFYVVGVFGCLSLWHTWRRNFVWLVDRLFIPALLNSTGGLLSTIVNVYTTQRGAWSATAKITVAATSSCISFSGIAFLAYSRKLRTLRANGGNGRPGGEIGSAAGRT